MTESGLIKMLGGELMALALLNSGFRLVAGIDLTEDQLFVQNWRWWVTSAGCALMGVVVAFRKRERPFHR